MEHNLVNDIAVCVIAAWVVAVASQVARQPLLLAYLVAGFAVGPNGFKWVTDAASIQVISHIGLSLLLFMIGLEIDLKRMVSAGKVITLTAAAQIFGCVALGWLFFGLIGLGGGWLEGLYLGVAVALSSTVIIVKILYDKRELDTLAGRITLGVLVLQDLFVIVFLAIQPNLKNPAPMVFGLAMLKVALLVGVGFVFSRFVLPPIFKFVARQPELVLVGALAWCFALAGFARYLGLSPEMGALIAGVMVSTFPYTLDVIAKVTSLRDFFVTLFFVGLGMTIPLPTWNIALWTLLVSAFVVVSRLVTVVPVLHSMRLGHRVSFLPALNLCQISELSLVLLALGKASGDVSDESMAIVAFAFAFLAIGSTYAIGRSDSILHRASPWLTRLGLHDLRSMKDEAEAPAEARAHLPAGIFVDRELAARGNPAAQAAAARRPLGRRFQSGGHRTAARPRRARRLRRHQPARHAAARGTRQGRDHHLLAAGHAAEGRQQPAAAAAAARAESQGEDHRPRREPVRRRDAVRGGGQLHQRAAAARGRRAAARDRGGRRQPAARKARRPAEAPRRARRSDSLSGARRVGSIHGAVAAGGRRRGIAYRFAVTLHSSMCVRQGCPSYHW